MKPPAKNSATQGSNMNTPPYQLIHNLTRAQSRLYYILEHVSAPPAAHDILAGAYADFWDSFITLVLEARRQDSEQKESL
jgi:hypothetical protein